MDLEYHKGKRLFNHIQLVSEHSIFLLAKTNVDLDESNKEFFCDKILLDLFPTFYNYFFIQNKFDIKKQIERNMLFNNVVSINVENNVSQFVLKKPDKK